MARTVAFLIYPQFQLLDLSGPLSAFEIAARYAGARYRLTVVAPLAGTADRKIMSSSGIAVVASPLSNLGRPDTLIVVGGQGTLAIQHDAGVGAFLRAQAKTARRIGSVCSGSFILAGAGLLDGRTATTHWRYAPLMAETYPKVDVSPDRIFVRDGKFWTSAGITAGIDLALAMIAEDCGEAAAQSAAEELVVYHRRSGAQPQRSALLALGRPENRFARLIAWLREHLNARLTIERMADQAGMSPRHFARVFHAETGLTPAKALEALRLDAARTRVEGGAEPFAVIASQCGFVEAGRMRRAFIRSYGRSPRALREARR
jgi:transcriptional regulator GlxA family with amidase domain